MLLIMRLYLLLVQLWINNISIFSSKLLLTLIIDNKKVLEIVGSNSRHIMYICLVKEPEV